MQLSQKFARQLFCIGILLFMSFRLPLGHAQTRVAPSSIPATAPNGSPARDPQADIAFDHFYNMDYDRAIQEFQKILDHRPDDPAAINHVLATTLMRELYRMGAMNTGEY